MPRPTILTQAALARVVTLVGHGRSAAEIADEMGCTLGTLRVRCSQLGISLRRRASAHRRDRIVAWTDAKTVTAYRSGERDNTIKQSGSVAGKSSTEVRVELKIPLPQTTIELLRQRGALRGKSGATLAAELLVTIARDGLYDAVLDER